MLNTLSHSRDGNEVVNLSISSVDEQNEVVINQKDLFSIEVILKYRRLFQSKKKAGIDSITENEFKNILCCYISSQYVIDDIYRKIDINCYGRISFSSFTNFLMTSDSTKKDPSKLVLRYTYIYMYIYI
jgi:Ca2+-binding EF-hand superfamily protein